MKTLIDVLIGIVSYYSINSAINRYNVDKARWKLVLTILVVLLVVAVYIIAVVYYDTYYHNTTPYAVPILTRLVKWIS